MPSWAMVSMVAVTGGFSPRPYEASVSTPISSAIINKIFGDALSLADKATKKKKIMIKFFRFINIISPGNKNPTHKR